MPRILQQFKLITGMSSGKVDTWMAGEYDGENPNDIQNSIFWFLL